MSGETYLIKLLQGMKPRLNQGEFVYCTVDSIRQAVSLEPLSMFQEEEAVTGHPAKTTGGRGVTRVYHCLCMDHSNRPFVTRSRRPDRRRIESAHRGKHQLQCCSRV